MSLRLRLTLLYTMILGGILMLFSGLIYSLVNVALLDQIDSSLNQAADQLTKLIHMTNAERLDTRSLVSFQATENLYIQVWDNDHHLQMSRPAGWTIPLDESHLSTTEVVYHSTETFGMHLRVLSLPLTTAIGPVGALQIGLSMSFVDTIQRSLATVLILLAAISMLLAGLITWLVTQSALAPLATVTRVATQITRADDLQRRIPLTGSREDEVGQLIQAFNQTLERLEKLFTSQRRFLADVSHELRTPLTVIKGNVGLMRKFGCSDEESLNGVDAEVDRLTRLVGDLLLLAQAETGRLPLSSDLVEIDTVFLEVYQQMKVLAGERIQVRMTEIDQVQVWGDRDRLKQVLLNLVGNAVQYTQAGGQVTMSLRKGAEQAQLIISDTGPGIPAEDQPHIFERFYRGEKSRKRSAGSGFGLGLSIANWIVRAHRGSIEVTSQEGKGTTFCVWLPLKK